MRSPTTRHLRMVAAIARTGKISAAANSLNVSGPAVTQQLQQLEEMVGMPLFDRDRQRMRPTAAGELLVDCARHVEDRITACVQSLEELKGLRSGRVAVGIVSTAEYFVAPLLGAFKRAYPSIELRLLVGNRREVVAALDDLDVDLAIMGTPPHDMPVDSVILGDHPQVVIAPYNHRLATQHRVPLSELAGETMLLREAGSGTRALADRLLASESVRPRATMEISSNETIKQAVIAGLGVALISAHTIAAELEARRLVIVDFEGLPLIRRWFVVRNTAKRQLPATASLWHFLIEQAPSFLPAVRPSSRRIDRVVRPRKVAGSTSPPEAAG